MTRYVSRPLQECLAVQIKVLNADLQNLQQLHCRWWIVQEPDSTLLPPTAIYLVPVICLVFAKRSR